MSWIIKRIDDADFGCEERMPLEPLMCRVCLENDESLETFFFEAPDEWLTKNDLNEGDEWPFEIAEDDDKAVRQNEWMYNYLDALEEMDEE